MKTENGYNELVLGNKNNASSHYRIKSTGFRVQLLTAIEGYRTRDKNEFSGFRHEFIVAKIDGNKVVMLFTLKNFIQWEYEGRHVPCVEISFDDYINPATFMKVVERHFLTLLPQNQAV